MKPVLQMVLTGILVCLAQGVSGAGTPDRWDRLLDRYESICRQCLDLKNRKDAGLSISSAQFQSLLDELEQLREQMQGETDKMPVAARYRFEAIRRMYASGVIMETHPPQPVSPLSSVSPPLVRVLDCSPSPRPRNLPSEPQVTAKAQWRVSASTVILPEFSYGVIASRMGRKWGGYAAFRSNYTVHRTAYDALSDGSAGDIRIWTSGKSAIDRMFITTGPVFRVYHKISLFGGAGYGFRRLCWEDSEGRWMRVSDASRSGFCTEIGASIQSGRLVFSTSWLSLPLTWHALTLSVGIEFR